MKGFSATQRMAGLLTLLFVGGCETLTRDLGREPEMTPSVPLVQSTIVRHAPARSAPVEQVAQNSTWSDRSSDLFRDARAMRPGDILTVKLSIKDRASFANSASRAREGKQEGQGRFGFGIDAFGLKRSGEGSVSADAGAKTSTDARGSVSRSETIDLVVAATIIDILPNGNLVISGSQEVRLNHELRSLNIEGIVRPRDISTDNSVAYEKVAEARVSYGGRGRTMEVLQPGIGQQIIDRIAPY